MLVFTATSRKSRSSDPLDVLASEVGLKQKQLPSNGSGYWAGPDAQRCDWTAGEEGFPTMQKSRIGSSQRSAQRNGGLTQGTGGFPGGAHQSPKLGPQPSRGAIQQWPL